MSYYAVQPSQPTHDPHKFTQSPHRPPQSFTPLPPHLCWSETFHFDTVEEADELRAYAAALKLKMHPERCALPVRHVTQDDLHELNNTIENVFAEIKCGVSLKKCYVSVDRLSYYSRLMCGPSKLSYV